MLMERSHAVSREGGGLPVVPLRYSDVGLGVGKRRLRGIV